MEAIEAILTRRSIRKFSTDPVGREELELLLAAAMSAPSAFNERPWHFVVVRDAPMRERLSQISEWSGPMAGAQVGVVVCGDTEALRRPGTVYWIFDCAAALENMLIAATGRGLGAVWLGIHPTPERVDSVRELLGLPEHVEPLGMVALGWPAEDKPPAERYDESRIHSEHW